MVRVFGSPKQGVPGPHITDLGPKTKRNVFDVCRFMDPNSGPLSELDKWKRRQRLLTNLTEQLKSKECKTVIGVLITAKSRLLKKWKIIDSGYVTLCSILSICMFNCVGSLKESIFCTTEYFLEMQQNKSGLYE